MPSVPSDRSATAGREDRVLTIAMWSAMAVAIAVRVAFLASKPFWRDEAWVAMLVGDPWKAVTDGRAVPFGFLLLTRIAAAVPALPAEITYRIVPLLCGLAVLPLLARLAVTLGATRRTAVATTWIAVGLQPFVYYSRELKPYEIDVLLAVLLPLLAVRGFTEPLFRRTDRWLLAACLAVAPWVSFGAIFTACALIGWGSLAWWRRLSATLRRDWILCTLSFFLSFAAVYVIALGGQASDAHSHRFWQHRLLEPREWSLWWRMVVAAWRYVSISTEYFFWTWWPGFVAVAAIGACTWPRRGRTLLAWMYVATGGACVAAAATDHYLLAHGRHLLFAAPVVLLWFTGGLEQLLRLVTRARGARLAAILLVVPVSLSMYWSWQAIDYRVRPFQSSLERFFRYDVRQDVHDAVARAAAIIPKGDPVLVTDNCSYPFQYYAHGRLPQASYCKRHCPGFRHLATAWVHRMEGDRGWIMMTDEELYFFVDLLEKAGFDHFRRVATHGVWVWELRRQPASEHAPHPATAAPYTHRKKKVAHEPPLTSGAS